MDTIEQLDQDFVATITQFMNEHDQQLTAIELLRLSHMLALTAVAQQAAGEANVELEHVSRTAEIQHIETLYLESTALVSQATIDNLARAMGRRLQ